MIVGGANCRYLIAQSTQAQPISVHFRESLGILSISPLIPLHSSAQAHRLSLQISTPWLHKHDLFTSGSNGGGRSPLRVIQIEGLVRCKVLLQDYFPKKEKKNRGQNCSLFTTSKSNNSKNVIAYQNLTFKEIAPVCLYSVNSFLLQIAILDFKTYPFCFRSYDSVFLSNLKIL